LGCARNEEKGGDVARRLLLQDVVYDPLIEELASTAMTRVRL
jgi:hypothetical protein